VSTPISSDPSNYEYSTTKFSELTVVNRGVYSDMRGTFQKPFIVSEYDRAVTFLELKEVNVSTTSKSGTIRGFHQQINAAAETKIVTCISGAIFDCVIDLRLDSKTFGGVFTIELSAKSGTSIVVPRGFAHGFQSLEDQTRVLYCVDNTYSPSSQSGVNPLSRELQGIWPLEVACISDQDANLPLWSDRINVSPWRP
jgi:dTDP-4-dehydrorhamnose 3,5-epimerase